MKDLAPLSTVLGQARPNGRAAADVDRRSVRIKKSVKTWYPANGQRGLIFEVLKVGEGCQSGGCHVSTYKAQMNITQALARASTLCRKERWEEISGEVWLRLDAANRAGTMVAMSYEQVERMVRSVLADIDRPRGPGHRDPEPKLGLGDVVRPHKVRQKW